jgi:hypothetical protein
MFQTCRSKLFSPQRCFERGVRNSAPRKPVRTCRSKRCCPGLIQREPLVDEVHFERFVAAADPLLRPDRDILWVLAGRTDTNHAKLKKILHQYKMHFEVFYLCYNNKQMHAYGHWKRQRGMANSKEIEQAFYCYKGRLPKGRPAKRMYVDAGTSLFNQIVKNVPVLEPCKQAFVSKVVRDISLCSMVGVTNSELQRGVTNSELQRNAKGGADRQDPPRDGGAELNQPEKKKRKLFRQMSGTHVPWFPHDNNSEVLKELVWEAGLPRWVLFGTPAGGAGIHGCLEMGCSVVSLCYDEHHRLHLNREQLHRAVEAIFSGSTNVFKDELLQARSIILKLAEAPSAGKSGKKSVNEETSKEKFKKNKAPSAGKSGKKSVNEETSKEKFKKNKKNQKIGGENDKTVKKPKGKKAKTKKITTPSSSVCASEVSSATSQPQDSDSD